MIILCICVRTYGGVFRSVSFELSEKLSCDLRFIYYFFQYK